MKNNGAPVSGNSLTLANGDAATCTITNDDNAASLTLVKEVTNDNGGSASETAWTLTAAGPTPLSGVTATAAVTNAAVNAGTYTLSESGGPSGYTASAYSCVKNNGAPVSGNSLTLANGDAATCTITNDDQAAHLTLVKTVTNDDGGTADPVDFALDANGLTPIAGGGGVDSDVDAGTYILSETGGPGGYTAGAWSCEGGTFTAPNQDRTNARASRRPARSTTMTTRRS